MRQRRLPRHVAARLFAGSMMLAVADTSVQSNSLARAQARAISRACVEPNPTPSPRPVRAASWAENLPGIEVFGPPAKEATVVRLYGRDGEIDEGERAVFERIAAVDGPPHPLNVRVEQLVFKAAYHFKNAPVVIVSAFRADAGRHGSAEAIDFKLLGVHARTLAAYLRGIPRAGVGIYTHPRTQYVHLDVREPSFHWIDASPPGVHWREAPLADRTLVARDASWTPEMDLP